MRRVEKVEFACRVCPEKDGVRVRFDNPINHLVTEHPTHLLQAPLGMLYDQIMVVPVYVDEPEEAVQTLDTRGKK